MLVAVLLMCALLLLYAVLRDRRPRNCPPVLLRFHFSEACRSSTNLWPINSRRTTAISSWRRQCAGEVLARTELFLFTAAIAQNFDVLPPPTTDLRRVKMTSLGGLRAPEDQELIYRPRP
ncbi:Cytochrome P450 CYP3214B [Hyalella azteca]|uniref:Cytochrome P450 CYP3214B n=1 Tax=Hyalella azteca TaxID=294128 RepID=A0A6A0H7K2_HYAAZ|nr:Cytochrome P450 CYP3214B [Hyalella azteca]